MNGKSKGSGLPMQTGVAKAIRDGSGALDKETQAKIGQQLRAMYDEVVRQGVPERFSDLLQRLERQEEATTPTTPAQSDRHEDGEP